MQAGDQLGDGVQRVRHRAAVPAGMQILRRPGQRELQPGQPAAGDRDRRFVDAPHAAVGRDDEIGGQQIGVRLDERLQAGAADLLLAFEHELDVDRQAALRGEECLRRLDRLEKRPLVVRHAAGIEAPVADRRREGRADPFLQRIGRLHVVVAVDQHGRLAGCAEPLREDDRVPPVGMICTSNGPAAAICAASQAAARSMSPRWAGSVLTLGMAANSMSSARVRSRWAAR